MAATKNKVIYLSQRDPQEALVRLNRVTGLRFSSWPGTAMAAFRDQLSDTQIAAVITYTRNAWDNAGKGPDPVVQPSDVKALR